MLLDRLDRVGGATWKITTRRGQELAEADLIPPNGENEQRSHVLPRLLVFKRRRVGGTGLLARAIEPCRERLDLASQLLESSAIGDRQRTHNDVHT